MFFMMFNTLAMMISQNLKKRRRVEVDRSNRAFTRKSRTFHFLSFMVISLLQVIIWKTSNIIFYYIQQWLETGFKMCLIHLYEPVCLSVRPAFHIAQQSYQILGLIYHQQSKMHCP